MTSSLWSDTHNLGVSLAPASRSTHSTTVTISGRQLVDTRSLPPAISSDLAAPGSGYFRARCRRLAAGSFLVWSEIPLLSPPNRPARERSCQETRPCHKAYELDILVGQEYICIFIPPVLRSFLPKKTPSPKIFCTLRFAPDAVALGDEDY